MIRALFSAASGMQAQQVKIDVVANNLANVSTTGYKAARAEFQDLLYEQLLAPGQAGSVNGVQVGHGVRLSGVQRVLSGGALQRTDSPLDLAVRGPGFFALQQADGKVVYSRDGAFRLDALRRLVNQQGLPVLAENGPVEVPAGVERLEVAADGAISYADPETGVLAPLDRLQLATFPNPQGLLALGQNLWAPSGGSGDALMVYPGDFGVGEIAQGHLEAANVEVVTEMVNLIVAQRAYEINSRALQAADEAAGMANHLRRG